MLSVKNITKEYLEKFLKRQQTLLNIKIII